MAGGTSISAEIYTYHKLLTVYSGSMDVFTSDGMSRRVNAGESLISPTNVPVGMKTDTGCVYTETGFPKETTMNQILRAGDVFKLKDLLPYQEGRIVNMDLIHEKNHSRAGETFKFDKAGRHSVKAVGRFKMALLLVLE